jgi:hypothetical protein
MNLRNNPGKVVTLAPMELRVLRNPIRTFMVTLMLACCLIGLGCTPKIPDKATTKEIDLYREWLKQRFASKAPEKLYLDDQTFAFDPQQRGCAKGIHDENHVPWGLMKALHALGNADYEVDVSPTTMQLPWKYQVLNVRQFPPPSPGLHVIGFSRVAFNGSGSEALFAVSDACAAGQCGGGSAVLAKKNGSKWEFTELKGCSWVY